MSELAPPEATPSAGTKATTRRRRGLAIVLGAVRWLVLLGLLAAMAVLWQEVQGINSVKIAFGDRLDEVRTRLAETRAAQMPATELERRLTSLQTELEATRQQAKSTALQVDPVLELLRQGRPAWYRAEAIYLMQMANQALQLRGDATSALRALWLADKNLETLGDPRFLPVRETLAREMAALRALPTVDLPGISLQLSALAHEVEHWLLLRHVPDHWSASTSTAVDSQAPSMWQQWLGVLRNLLEIRRAEGPVAALASPELERLQRLQTILQIQAARLALLQRDGKTFQSELEGALSSLQTYFDVQDPAVQSARQQLKALQNVQIDPQRPDLSGSLAQMRALEAEMVMP
ncbi:MAG: uroporphyrinogen-III C-methyltransferase [Candidatus Macondimonas sp.]